MTNKAKKRERKATGWQKKTLKQRTEISGCMVTRTVSSRKDIVSRSPARTLESRTDTLSTAKAAAPRVQSANGKPMTNREISKNPTVLKPRRQLRIFSMSGENICAQSMRAVSGELPEDSAVDCVAVRVLRVALATVKMANDLATKKFEEKSARMHYPVTAKKVTAILMISIGTKYIKSNFTI